MRLQLLACSILWLGATISLAELRWFARRSLSDRLRPHTPAARGSATGRGVLSVDSLFDVLAPVAQVSGAWLGRIFGVNEDLGVRLERIHSPLTTASFRLRQLGLALLSFALGTLIVELVRPPISLGLLLLLGSPVLAFLVIEQRVSSQSDRWRQRLFLELPIITEQLAMLVTCGFSLGAALTRIAQRGNGACTQDLRRVLHRVRQGLSETEALREWASRAQVEALDRLVPILAMNNASADLGRLMTEESRGIRRDAHRKTTETMDRRAQSVWIPVTVATLVPGVILLAIPFNQALRLFTSG